MTTTVLKFGGTSLATTEKIRRVAAIAHGTHTGGAATVVVVSARGKTTDDLIAAATALTDAPSARETDQLLATGENASAALVALALLDRGVPAVSLTGPQAGILAAGPHGAGMIAAVDPQRITAHLARGRVVVVAGFQGEGDDGDIVTLGRGGSDTTAVALAVELGARACEIYTDVDGVFTADPRLVPTARVLPTVDPLVMAEMAFSGAQVMHSRAVELASVHGLDVLVRNTMTGAGGTTILGRSSDMIETRGFIAAVTHDRAVARVVLRRGRREVDLVTAVLGAFARAAVPVDMLAWHTDRGAVDQVGFAVHRGQLVAARALLRQLATTHGLGTELDEGVGKLSVVGTGLLNRPEFLARMLAALATIDVAPDWFATAQSRISVLVPASRLTEAVIAVHREFELDADDLPVESMTLA
ncbi:aspartate kinase [Actinokineospora terrae]|uniref:Aspartokinase n=1 Tax=Actinokineospora terrae TaxID=155974 RepID=A0A1H9LGG5_9PSEU|nr:aspartate kinase [Actinokineospora terrae]SER10339.1 aspartate kinase [Actinokineospora terrae]